RHAHITGRVVHDEPYRVRAAERGRRGRGQDVAFGTEPLDPGEPPGPGKPTIWIGTCQLGGPLDECFQRDCRREAQCPHDTKQSKKNDQKPAHGALSRIWRRSAMHSSTARPAAIVVRYAASNEIFVRHGQSPRPITTRSASLRRSTHGCPAA